jgi:hypothetical protein
MKNFLKLTFLFEGFIGIALIFVPKLVVSILFETTLEGKGGIMIAMIAGAAIVSIALICWIMKEIPSNELVKILLFYNVAVVAIVIYGMLHLEIKGLGLWLVVVYHSVFAIWSWTLFKKSNVIKGVKNGQ